MNNMAISSFDELPLYLTVEEACQVLRIGKSIGYNLVRCGQLPSIRLGKKIRIPKNALAEYMEKY